jgi:hypothetical protein
MAIHWGRKGDRDGDAMAMSRWVQAVEGVSERFAAFDHMSLDEAVETALLRTPGNMSREELTRRLSERRGVEPGQF